MLGYDDWLAGLTRGVAAHHAGLLPTFKEVVEELFAAGLIRAVFATETLALGINMPASTVVIERLDKWNGETHAALTAGEYTQLTGRAGRRGIDVEGHAVVLWQPGIDPLAVAGLAGTRTYPLNSSFQPSYNMAVNLVGQVGRERAAKLLESSFAQFQADRAVVGLARQARKLRESGGRDRDATCDRGDFIEYARMRADLSQLEKDAVQGSLGGPPGVSGRIARRARPGRHHRGARRSPRRDRRRARARRRNALAPAPLILTEHRQLKRLSPAECPDPVVAVLRMPIPGRFSPRSPQQRKDLAATMRNKFAGVDLDQACAGRSHQSNGAGRPAPDRAGQAARTRRSPTCGAGCANIRAMAARMRNAHARQADKFLRAEREAEALDRRVAGRAHVIARTFERVCAVLGHLGYLDGDKVTADGRMLAGIYSELDLLAAECLRRGMWNGLSPAGAGRLRLRADIRGQAARGRRPAPVAWQPGRQRVAAMTRLWGELDGTEHDHRLSFLREPDLGFAWTSHAWASGRTLEHLLQRRSDAGRFCQGGQAADRPARPDPCGGGQDKLADTAAEAISALRRGVVAYTSVQ